MASIEFSGVEVKCGVPLKVKADDGVILHLSQASLGESKSGKDKESVPLFVKCDGQKLVLGTLSQENIPQLALHLVMEKEFELSHKSKKNGSVYFTRYKSAVGEDKDGEYSDFCSEDVAAAENGKAVKRKADLNKLVIFKTEYYKPKSKPDVPVKPEADSDEDDDSDDEDESRKAASTDLIIFKTDVVSKTLTPIRNIAKKEPDRMCALISKSCNATKADIKPKKEIDEEMQDTILEYERKRNMPERCYRDVVSDALTPIRNIAKKEPNRKWAVVSKRCNEMTAVINAKYKEIDAALEFVREINMLERCNKDVVSDTLTPIRKIAKKEPNRKIAKKEPNRKWAVISERCKAMAAVINDKYKEKGPDVHDVALEFVREMNTLERCDRDVVSDALTPITNIAKKEPDRKCSLISKRCNPMAADIKANYKEIDAGVRDIGLEMRKLDSCMGNFNFKVTLPAQTAENQVMEE